MMEKPIHGWGASPKQVTSRKAGKLKRDVGRKPEVDPRLAEMREGAPKISMRRDWIYEVLQYAYEWLLETARDPALQAALKSYHKSKMPKKKRQYSNVILRIIGHGRFRKNIYKYANTLMLAYEYNVEPKHLKARIKEQGGINACDDQWSAIAKEKQIAPWTI